MIVHKTLAPELIEIFDELYQAQYPIEQIRLIDEYDANDATSMADNNSVALCVRSICWNPDEFSKHSFGIALDINPLQNPFVKNGTVDPLESAFYEDRNTSNKAPEKIKGMILKHDACYNAFTNRGRT